LNYKTIAIPDTGACSGHDGPGAPELGSGGGGRDEGGSRALFAKVAEPVLDRGLPDVTLMRLTASGARGGKPARRVYEMIEYPDAEHG